MIRELVVDSIDGFDEINKLMKIKNIQICNIINIQTLDGNIHVYYSYHKTG